MTTNLTLITSIVLTAAVASAGTYYVTTRVDPGRTIPLKPPLCSNNPKLQHSP